MAENKRIIAIDETWCGETNYLRQAWSSNNESESQRINVVQPRITMMAAIDNFGNAYLSLLLANTNQYTFAEFVRELAETLDNEDQ